MVIVIVIKYLLVGWSLARPRPALTYRVNSRESSNQNDEILSRNSLRYLSKANLPIEVYAGHL